MYPRSCCEYVAQRVLWGESKLFRKLKVRFSAPVYPGDTLGLRAWHDGDGRALFEVHVGEVVVINHAYFEYASA